MRGSQRKDLDGGAAALRSARQDRLARSRFSPCQAEWTYVSVRRLVRLIEPSLDRGTRWAVLEPNDSGRHRRRSPRLPRRCRADPPRGARRPPLRALGADRRQAVERYGEPLELARDLAPAGIALLVCELELTEPLPHASRRDPVEGAVVRKQVAVELVRHPGGVPGAELQRADERQRSRVGSKHVAPLCPGLLSDAHSR